MNDQNKLGPAEIIPPVVAVIGTIIWISIDGFTGESIAQSLTSLCTMFVILIPLYRHILRKPKDTHLEAGIRACADVRAKHPDLLAGPKFRKDDYIPGAMNNDHQYLFIQRPESRRKAVFIAVAPFKKAIVEIGISHTTLELLKITGDFEAVKHKLHDELLAFAHHNFDHLFIEKNVEKYENICIVLDFDIEKVSAIEFRNISAKIMEAALTGMLNMNN